MPLHCPRDGQALVAEIYEADIEIDKCGTCRGVWLDKGELEDIQRTVERDHSAATRLPDDPTIPVDSARIPRGAITCPKGQGPLDARRYGLGSDVTIDVCPEGCGVWLDEGELESLEVLYEKSQAEVEIPLHWRLWAGVVGVFGSKKKK